MDEEVQEVGYCGHAHPNGRHHQPAVPVALPGLRGQPLAVDAGAGGQVVDGLKLAQPGLLCRGVAGAGAGAVCASETVSGVGKRGTTVVLRGWAARELRGATVCQGCTVSVSSHVRI